MKTLLSALRFTTLLPLGRGKFAPRAMVAGMPLAGLAIGLLLAGFDWLVASLWPLPAVAALDLVFLAVITGGLHLDGVADTADGLYGGHDRDTALAIMKDSRTGAIGVVALVCCLAVKWAGLASLEEDRFLLLVLVPAFARSGSLFGFRALPYGRPEGGTAGAFFDADRSWSAFRWFLPVVVLSLLAGSRFFMINLGFVLVTAGMLWFYKKKVNCITGDMLGAMIEVTEALLFLLVAAG
ncbi:MAG: adenosylcobinamide-GDP ribazoletransferase [Desulfosudaceae bacterium]